ADRGEVESDRGPMRRLMILILAAGVLLVVAEQSAQGCSCASSDARNDLARAYGAFIGRLISSDKPTPDPDGMYLSGQEVTYHFRVDRALKGRLGSTVEVRSASDGAACGIESQEGK